MGFRGHNLETGMVHSRKYQRSRRKLIVSTSDDDDDYTDKDYSMEDDSNQLVLYHKRKEVQFTISTSPHQRPPTARYGRRKVPIRAYVVQCAKCLKWRSVPTQEKYEELRESISWEDFVCARAREWNPVISCDDPEDMSQYGSMVWAIDKPDIARTPPGWYREIRIRGEGCTKFADVYYTSPTGARLRSLVEIERYLKENPHYGRQGVNLSRFSMATPEPLQKDYIRKPKYSARHQLPEPLEVNPPGWAPPIPIKKRTPRQASNPVDLDEPAIGTSASNPVDLDEPEVYAAPPPCLPIKKRPLRQAWASSSEQMQSTLTEATSSGEPKKRTLNQVSRRRPTAPPSWPRSGR